MSHHSATATTAASQVANRMAANLAGVRVANHTVGTTRATPEATAFTPPVAAKASADQKIRQRHVRLPGSTRGSNTQGATAIGQTSTDVTATSDRKRGPRAYNSAAT